jgi:hypothetical protein
MGLAFGFLSYLSLGAGSAQGRGLTNFMLAAMSIGVQI